MPGHAWACPGMLGHARECPDVHLQIDVWAPLNGCRGHLYGDLDQLAGSIPGACRRPDAAGDLGRFAWGSGHL